MQQTTALWETVAQQALHALASDPWLCAASIGMFVSAGYLLLMVVTRLGDIRRGVQSLILSALLHSLLFVFWGTVAVNAARTRGDGTGDPGEEALEIPVRQMVVEDGGAEAGADAGGDPAAEGTPVWDRIPTLQQSAVARSQLESAPNKPIETPERTAERIEESAVKLPDVPRPPEEVAKNPDLQRPDEAEQRSAIDDQVEIAEETAEARSEPAARGASSSRTARDTPATAEMNPERAAPKDKSIEAFVGPAAHAVLDASESEPAAIVQAAPAKPTVSHKGAAATPELLADEAGSDGGATKDSNEKGEPKGIRFSRVAPARAPLDRDPAPTLERSRPKSTGAGGGQPAGPPLLASRDTERGIGSTGMPRPDVSRPVISGGSGRGGAQVPETYRLRNLPQREKLAVSLGATHESERAVEASLKWLVQHQDADGSWDASSFNKHCPSGDRCWGLAGQANQNEVGADRQHAGMEADTGLTALIILTFLGAGYTHEDGEYADHVDRALRWLIRQQTSDGMLGGKAGRYDRMYCHGMATYALGEASGMSNDPTADPQLRNALSRAVQYIIKTQNPDDGGWRYLPGQKGDMSMFGWQLMGLKSAQIAGMQIPAETRANMVRFLKDNTIGNAHGLAAYIKSEKPKPSMTAEALFSRQMLGMKRTNAASKEAVEYLMRHLPKQSEPDLYYWYYGTLAMYQYGGEPWQEWNARLRDALVALQIKKGHAAGSWEPRDPWGGYGGRLYSTALGTLCLEVYYRFLPLYQLGGEPRAEPEG